MSGDKLLGGPQAGIILGDSTLVAKLRKNPLTRAMRVDKLTLSALEATLRLYLEPERALRDIPVLAMLTTTAETLAERAQSIVAKLSERGIETRVAESIASVGGGAFPTAEIPSVAVSVSGNAQIAERKLRLGDPAVIGRIVDGHLLLDMRSVLPRDDAVLVDSVSSALS
jgi:L-seryl-tRNA(Ser) seleniumtransferase